MAGGAPPEWREKVLHATIAVGDRRISGIDLPPDQYERPRGFQIDLNLDDVPAAQRIFAEFAQDGQVTVPLQQTFWAKQFGAVVDLFGIPWAINCE
jgi:PhnB protein